MLVHLLLVIMVMQEVKACCLFWRGSGGIQSSLKISLYLKSLLFILEGKVEEFNPIGKILCTVYL